MPEPCRSCDEKEKDFGGCRCQAFMLTGDASNADPVCSKSEQHGIILKAREAEPEKPPTAIATDSSSKAASTTAKPIEQAASAG